MSKGLRFYKLDLHVHTPASPCFGDENVTAEMIVDAALAANLAAIAVTDHNTGEWVDQVKAVGVAHGLTIFPGVEIAVEPGIHIVALFDTDKTTAHINDLLAQLGILTDNRGLRETLVTRHSPEEVVAIIRNHEALPVLAHIDDVKGAWKELAGQTRIQLFEKADYAAVEFVAALPPELGRSPYLRMPASYRASDNPMSEDPKKHSLRGIGARCSWFKGEEPLSLENLRQCFDDPEVRIQTDLEHKLFPHAILESVSVTGGFLDGLQLELNPDLNALIGGRGTGKSTLLELVRYAFDAKAKTEANEKQARDLIQNTLPPGSFVTIGFQLADGTRYRVERTQDRDPRLLRSDSGDLVDAAPTDCLQIEVYGQKEVYEISKDPAFQLRLLDNYIAEQLISLQDQERDLLVKLRDNASTILKVEEEIETASEKVDQLGAIREELSRMEKQGFTARVEQKRLLDHEAYLLNRVEAIVQNLEDAVTAFAAEHEISADLLDERVIGGLPHADMLRRHRMILQAIQNDLAQTMGDLRERIQAAWDGGVADRAEWQKAREAQDGDYQALLREFQSSGQLVEPDRYIQLQARANNLEQLHLEIEQQKGEIAKLEAARLKLLDDLIAVRRQQTELRQRKAKDLTQRLRKAVSVTVQPAGHRQVFKSYLRDIFSGRDVRNPTRDNLAIAIHPVASTASSEPSYLSPLELAQAIGVEKRLLRGEIKLGEGEANPLEKQFGVSSAPMRNNMAGLSRQQIFELETFGVPDLPVIELRVGGKLRALESLSVGQKCTAVLSLILLESEMPLLIDQPEDDLDNQFIFDQIVATLRQEKERRQFIVATHNANIPVSGDAELIIVLDASQDRGRVTQQGSIDSQDIKTVVKRVLEGGADAFRIRQQKYGPR